MAVLKQARLPTIAACQTLPRPAIGAALEAPGR
jgi:hypothetical protein